VKNMSKKTTAAAAVAFVAVAGFVGFGLWKASQPAPEVFQGQIEAQEADIAPKVTARIAQILVKEGDQIAVGAPLIRMDSPEVQAKLAQATAAQEAAQAVAAAVAVAMVDGTTAEILAAACACLPADSWMGRATARALAIAGQAATVEQAWMGLHDELWTPLHAVSPEAIPQALALFKLTDGDFRQGMFWSCNFGRDADTISAVVGALAGARHGRGAIPDAWIDRARHPAGVCLKFAAQEDVVQLAEQLAELIR